MGCGGGSCDSSSSNQAADRERHIRELNQKKEELRRAHEERKGIEADRKRLQNANLRNSSELNQKKEELRRAHEKRKGIEADRKRLQKELQKYETRIAKEEAKKKALLDYPVATYMKQQIYKRATRNILVVGRTRTGKSTWINSFRKMSPKTHKNHPEYAKVRTGRQGTMDVNIYPVRHASTKEYFTLVDLPGHGTIDFPMIEYPRKFGLKHADCVYLFLADSIQEADVHMMNILKEQKISFHTIFNKFDTIEQDCEDNGEDLRSIRAEMVDELFKHGVNTKNLFFISSRHKYRHKYDFPKLEKALSGLFMEQLQDYQELQRLLNRNVSSESKSRESLKSYKDRMKRFASNVEKFIAGEAIDIHEGEGEQIAQPGMYRAKEMAIEPGSMSRNV